MADSTTLLTIDYRPLAIDKKAQRYNTLGFFNLKLALAYLNEHITYAYLPQAGSRIYHSCDVSHMCEFNPPKYKKIREHLSTLPTSYPVSTIDLEELNYRVRNGNGCFLLSIRHSRK